MLYGKGKTETNNGESFIMIFDRVENLSRYSSLFSGADKVVKFLAEAAARTPAPGKYELDGKQLFVNVQEYAPKTFAPDKCEYHNDYIDIQLLLDGAEDLYYAPLDGLATVTEYSAEKDYGMKRLPAPESGTRIRLVPGNFVLLFPGEGHLPGVGDPASRVVKAVVKIRVR